MRDIRFRAWDKEDKKWLDPGHTQLFLDSKHIRIGYYDGQFNTSIVKEELNYKWPERLELIQHTGLKDKNGVEIYEGDLFGDEDEVFGEVYFDTDFAGFCVKYPSGGWTTLGEHLMEKSNHCEVIGNIHEHPELLKDKE